MKHADIQRHLAAYLEGELPLDERALVDAHLDECAECARDVDEMQRTVRLLRAMPDPEVPPMIAANVMRRIRAGEGRPGWLARLGRGILSIFEPGFVLPASALAAAALVFAVFQGGDGPGLFGIDGLDAFVGVGDDGSSVASVPTPLGRAGDRVRGPMRPDAFDESEIAARVERRAMRSRAAAAAAARAEARSDEAVRTPTARIRIEFDPLRVARSVDGVGRPTRSPAPVLTPRVPMTWASDREGLAGSGGASGSSPGTLVTAERSVRPGSRASSEGWARSEPAPDSDPRDAWLALGFEDPSEFARYIAAQNLAEQELWAARLADRAQSQGLLDDFLRALRESGDPTAAWVADDFAAQAADRMSGASSRGAQASAR